ncbi:MAG: hypothetical protein QOD56_1709 [Gammaproteobacteria bacterium]|nr:hypothetical protein [Gammaproteobacteria bacterium]
MLAAVCWLAAAPTFAVAPLVNATLEPRQISVGESAQLTITSSGTGMEPITLPEVAGLEFRVVGQSRRIEIINGATLLTTSIIVRITPQTVGIFTIPGITPKSQPLVLRVNPDNGSGNSSPSGRSNFPGRPPVVPGGSTVNGIRMTADGSAFVRMNLPKRPVYVGESIPVDIEVGMRAGFVTSLNGLPTLTGSEFTLNNLSHQPERVEKVIDGQPFTLLTWHSVLAPVKPGTFTLSVETPLTVRVRTRPAKDSVIDDLLGDPFLQNFFGATVPKDITVSSPAADLTVLALPMEGRPSDFSGAVGTFKVASELSSTTAATGDPLTLRMQVSGAGNFDRVDSPMLEHVDQWKTYPPKSSFKSGDAVGLKGEKTFEQPLIASRPGPQTLPGVAFSYFDPNTRHYETARSAPLKVTISPSLADSTLTAPQAPAGAAAPGVPAHGPSGLRPDHAMAESFVHSLVPLYMQPRFLALPSLLALAFAAGWLGLRHRAAVSGEPKPRERLSKAANRIVRQMELAAGSGDAALFLNAARAGLQQALAARWQVDPDRVTTDELDIRLGGDGGDDGDNGEAIRRIFALADEANYSGHQMTTTDYARWTGIVRQQLASGKPT